VKPSLAPRKHQGIVAEADQRILAQLSPTNPTSIDELAAALGDNPVTVSSRLVELELADRVCRAPGGLFLLVADSSVMRHRRIPPNS